MRKCPKCKTYKPTEEFPASATRKSGVGAWCLECCRMVNRDRYNRTKKRPRQPRIHPPFVKISEAEWKIRKANSKERAKERAKSEQVRKAKRLYAQKQTQLRKAEREHNELRKDIERIQTSGVKLKRSRRKICPVLKLSPDLLAEAQTADRKRRNALVPVERRRQLVKDWKRQNPAQVSIQRYRRRVNFQNCVADLTEAQWSQIKAAYKYRCGYCHKRKPLTQDHVIPVSKGGDHTASNIIPACQSCNSRKNARLPIVAYQPHLIA